MNTLVAMKPAAALLSVCGIAAAVLVASQVGLTPIPIAHAGEEGGIELVVSAEGEEGLAEEKVDVEVEMQKSDASPAPRTGFGPAGEYGRGGGALGVAGFGDEGEMGGYGTGIVPGVSAKFSTQSPLPHVVDLKPRSGMEIRIEQALTSTLPKHGLILDETPLNEAVALLRDDYEIEILFDTQALDDMGLSADEPVTCNLKNIRLGSALDLMLKQHNLTYIIRNEVLLITSEDEALSVCETRAYPADVMLGQSAAELIKVITTTVAPNTWLENGGGEGAIAHIGDRLVIYQTYAVHREINELLSQLRTVNESSQ